ncbi:hypothetical protein TcBrA4_0123200 [Trypanosoma cruzi]|nr:hypothetical protein TcBrA4_0123200 [Trypanosoma cruzi]
MSQGNVARPHLPHSMPLPSRASPLEDDSGAEDQVLHFLAFDLTTWVPRIWNDVISGVPVDLRCAYGYYWHRGDAHAQIAFDGLVSCRRALEIARDPTDRLMDFGRALLRTFRMQLMMASDPSIRLSKFRDRLHMAVHGADTFARSTQPLV